MYVGPWQEYKLAQVLQYYRNVEKEYEKLKRREALAERPTSSRTQATDLSGASIPSRASAPARINGDPSPILPPLHAYRNTQRLNRPPPTNYTPKPPLPRRVPKPAGKQSLPSASIRQSHLTALYMQGAAAERGTAEVPSPTNPLRAASTPVPPSRLTPMSARSSSPAHPRPSHPAASPPRRPQTPRGDDVIGDEEVEGLLAWTATLPDGVDVAEA